MNLRSLGTPAVVAVLTTMFGFVPVSGQDGPLGLSPAIGATIGTSGIGLELSTRFHERIGARLGVGWIPVEVDFEDEDGEVDGTVSPPSPIVRLVADFFPRGGTFHLSAGIQHFSGGLKAVAIPADSVEIGNNRYSPEEIGRIEGTIWGSETAPYLGLGWQNRSGRIQPYFELGVALTGSPKVSLEVLGPAAGEVDLEQDLEEEIREVEDDASSFKVFPHLMFGLRVRLGG